MSGASGPMIFNESNAIGLLSRSSIGGVDTGFETAVCNLTTPTPPLSVLLLPACSRVRWFRDEPTNWIESRKRVNIRSRMELV